MNKNNRFKRFCFVGVVLIVSAVQQAHAAASYAITDLGAWLYPSNINNRGDVIGSSAMNSSPFLYQNGILIDLRAEYGLGSSRPKGLNDLGQMVGTSGNGSYLYSNGTLQYINVANANGINNQGQITGEYYATVTENGVTRLLPALPGGAYGEAEAINNQGQVVGVADTFDYRQHAVLWDERGVHDLGTLPGYLASNALSINDKGQIVGVAFNPIDSYGVAVFIDSDGVMRALLPNDGYASSANDINNNGEIVGAWASSAYLFSNGNMLNLSTLPEVIAAGWIDLDDAFAINDRGQIVGYGLRQDGFHGFLLTPVPLPSAAWVFGSACLSMLCVSRRSKKRIV